MNRLKTYSLDPEPESKAGPKIIGYLIAMPVCALLLMWYNYVWIQWPVAYWQWLALAVPLAIAGSSPIMRWLMGILSIGALLGQVASWVGLVVLPFIKLQ